MKKTLIFTLISLPCIACSDNSTSVSDEEFVEKIQVFEAKITWGNKKADKQILQTMTACSTEIAPLLTVEEKETLLHFNGMLAKALSDQSAMEAFRNQDKDKLAYFKTVDKSYRNKLMSCLKNK